MACASIIHSLLFARSAELNLRPIKSWFKHRSSVIHEQTVHAIEGEGNIYLPIISLFFFCKSRYT